MRNLNPAFLPSLSVMAFFGTIFVMFTLCILCSYVNHKNKVHAISAMFNNYFVIHAKYVKCLDFQMNNVSFDNFLQAYRALTIEEQSVFHAQFLFATKLSELAEKKEFILATKLLGVRSCTDEANKAAFECWKFERDVFTNELLKDGERQLSLIKSDRESRTLIEDLIQLAPEENRDNVRRSLNSSWREISLTSSKAEYNELKPLLLAAKDNSSSVSEFRERVAEICKDIQSGSVSTVMQYTRMLEGAFQKGK